MFSTEIVGSYHKPHWLIRPDRAASAHARFFRPDDDVLDCAKQAAVRLAIDDQERASMDIVTDGEQTRQSFTSHFFKFGGLDTNQLNPRNNDRWPGDEMTTEPRQTADDRSIMQVGPTVTGPITWAGPVVLDDLRFAKKFARKPVKMTVAGPFTLSNRMVNAYYSDRDQLTLAVADALNKELKALDDEGLAIIQLDDPEIHFRFHQGRAIAVEALNRAVHGITTTTAVHICYGYSIYLERKWVNPNYAPTLDMLATSDVSQISLEYEQPGHEPDILTHVGKKIAAVGFVSSGSTVVESVAHIRARIKAAAEVVPPDRLKPSTDCGLWFLARDPAFNKLSHLAQAAASLRE